MSRALGRADLSKKVAASELGISESQLSNQLAYDGDTHRDHLSFWRMERLPPEFWQELLVGIAEHYDLTVQTAQDRADIELGRRFRALLGLAVSG